MKKGKKSNGVVLKTIKISGSNYEALTRLKGELTAKTGRNASYDDVIRELIKKKEA